MVEFAASRAGQVSRRLVLKWLAVWPAAAAYLGVRPRRTAAAGDDLAPGFAAADAETAMRALFGDEAIEVDAGIIIEADELAEDGAVVPVRIEVGATGVTAVYLFASRNPVPLIGRFRFPAGLAGSFKTRVKLAETSELIVVTESPRGRYLNRRQIEVAIGGCSVMS